jgi:hypothetical protein
MRRYISRRNIAGRHGPDDCTTKPRDELPSSRLRLQRFAGKPIAIRGALESVLTAADEAAQSRQLIHTFRPRKLSIPAKAL